MQDWTFIFVNVVLPETDLNQIKENKDISLMPYFCLKFKKMKKNSVML